MVMFSGGVYAMSGGSVSQLIYDPLPLIYCDDTRVEKTEDGYVVTDADAGELLYELGLRDGDLLLDLNGFSLETSGDVLVALAELWYMDGEDQYELYLQRGLSYITLDYFVYWVL
jgi:hypothetical protein